MTRLKAAFLIFIVIFIFILKPKLIPHSPSQFRIIRPCLLLAILVQQADRTP